MAECIHSLGASVELVEVSTQGDVQQSGSIASIGTQGVFTKEIQAAVLNGSVDIAVHSLKDLPTETLAGLQLAAVPVRASLADALVCREAESLDSLPRGAKIGTGSLRRQAQLLALRPDLQVLGIRGNVDTRLRKLDEGQYDAIILAEAGLTRLGWQDRITELLSPPRMLPAPGQGALGLECRADDHQLQRLLVQLGDPLTYAAVTAERSMLGLLHAGCSAPVGAWARTEGDKLKLDGLVASLDGKQILTAAGESEPTRAYELGQRVAEELLDQGASAVILAAKNAS